MPNVTITASVTPGSGIVSIPGDFLEDLPATTEVITIDWDFPANIGSLYRYAFQGGNTALFSNAEKAIIHLLQQPTNIDLPGSGSLLRGDINHSFRTASNDASVQTVITSADSLAMLGIQLGLKRSDPNSIGQANQSNETYNEHTAYNIIRPILETGNSTGMVRYLSENLFYTPGGGSIGSYSNSTHTFSISSSGGLSAAILTVAANGTPVAANVAMDNLLRGVAQTKYLYGDVTGSTFHGPVNNTNTDTDSYVLINFKKLALSNSNRANANALLSVMVSNATINPLLVNSSPTTSVIVPYLPSVYEGSNFNVDVNFNVTTGNVSILDVSSTSNLSPYGITITKTSANTFTLSGSYSNVLERGNYTFLMRDGTLKNLSADTTEDYKAVVEFTMPSVKYKLLTTSYDVTYSDGSNISVVVCNISQYVYWSFSTSLDAFKQLVNSRS